MEVKAITKYLDDLLSCRFESMPKEFAIHHNLFWTNQEAQQDLNSYGKCMKQSNVTRTNTARCHMFLKDSCSQRFGNDVSKHQPCMDVLWNTTRNRPVENVDHPEAFAQYTQCMKEFRQKSDHCTSNLQQVCKKAKLRITKTVRATMDSVESIISTTPNIRVIHLIRDPRAVVLSRHRFCSSGQSMYAGGDMVKEAELFCRNLARDVALRRSLEKKYPGVFMEVRYDKFVLDPLEYTKNIYNFINVTLDEKVKDWVVNNTEKKSTSIASKWLRTMTFSQVQQISEVCKNYFKLVPHDWMPGV